MIGNSIPQKYLELRRIYEKEFRPLISKGNYDEAFSFLLKNPDIKAYLIPSDIHTMYNFVESELAKLKGLEGKTK